MLYYIIACGNATFALRRGPIKTHCSYFYDIRQTHKINKKKALQLKVYFEFFGMRACPVRRMDTFLLVKSSLRVLRDSRAQLIANWQNVHVFICRQHTVWKFAANLPPTIPLLLLHILSDSLY